MCKNRLNRLHCKEQFHLHCLKKSIPDIFDCNLKTNYQILINFGTNIHDTTCHQDHSVSHLTQRLFLHYLGRAQPAKYYFFIQLRCDCLINIMHKKHILFTFLTLWLTFYSVVHFQLPAVKLLVGPTMQTQTRRRFLHSLTAVSIMFCSRPIQAVPVASWLCIHS